VSCLHCLSASLHVKANLRVLDLMQKMFQTPFGITACESQASRDTYDGHDVSNAFRHHCM